MNIIYEQNGGSEHYYEYDCYNREDITENTPAVPVVHNTRSFLLWVISEDQYNKLKNADWDNGLMIKLYTPGDEIDFKTELITTDDYNYPDKTVCNSSCFTDDIIEEYRPDINTYRMVGIDMIWCRENLLTVTVNSVIN